MVQTWNPLRPDLNGAWNYPAWSLSVEAFFYLCFPFKQGPPLQDFRRRGLLILGAAAALIAILGHTPTPRSWYFCPCFARRQSGFRFRCCASQSFLQESSSAISSFATVRGGPPTKAAAYRVRRCGCCALSCASHRLWVGAWSCSHFGVLSLFARVFPGFSAHRFFHGRQCSFWGAPAIRFISCNCRSGDWVARPDAAYFFAPSSVQCSPHASHSRGILYSDVSFLGRTYAARCAIRRWLTPLFR